MTPTARTSSKRLRCALVLGLLLAPSACLKENQRNTAQVGADGGKDSALPDTRPDQAPDVPITGSGGAGGGNVIIGSGGSAPSTGGSISAVDAAGGSLGTVDGGSIDGGFQAVDGGGGTGGGGTGGADAAVDTVNPALLGIGGFAPYKLGPRNGGGPFYCPRMMLFSPEMNQAAVDDAVRYGWPVGSFYYGVATLNNADCCTCWQLVFDRPENSGLKYESPRPLIIQMFNSGGNDGAFDIYMGKGGLGAVPRCPEMYQNFPMVGENFGGGIRASSIAACGKTQATLAAQACLDAVTKACNEIVGKSQYVTDVTRNSCIVANKAGTLYHENFRVKAKRVECPQALIEVTGCKLKPGSDPKPDPAVQTVAQAQAAGFRDYSTTTMQDCSAATCAWPENVRNTESPWTAQYLCDDQGKVNAKAN